MSNLDLAVVGNCTFGGLIDRRGRLVWACLPRFDSDPLFCSLLNGERLGEEYGFYDVAVDNLARSEQRYLHNTAILVTTLFDATGAALEIVDFAPRFKQYGRLYRPVMLVRLIRPKLGTPRIRVRVRPSSGYGSHSPEITHGSNHIRYVTPDLTMRLTRLLRRGDARLFERLERIGAQAAKLYDKPDAGMWEYRGRACVHTFSGVMCWAACDRLAKVAKRLKLSGRASLWHRRANRIRAAVLKNAWNPRMKSFVESSGGRYVDASLLLLHELGVIEPGDPRFVSTVTAVEKELRRGKFLLRYANADDFGVPRNSFIICTFWYIEALAAMGRTEEARDLFENMLACRNHLGLLSEDIDPKTGELWGNFPQTYSMVGLIHVAMRLSRSWEQAF